MINSRAIDMNLEKEKLRIIKWVTTLKDDTSIERLKMLKENYNKQDWWDEIADDEKNAIDKGLSDVKAGRVKPHKDAKKLYKKWL